MENTSPTRHPIGPVPWVVLCIVGVTLAVTQLGYYLTAAALPLYLRDLGASPGRIGFEVGLGNIAGVGVTLLLGPALNRRGTRSFLRASALLYVVAAGGMLVMRQEAAVTVFRTLQGIGSAIIMPASMAHAARLVPGRTGTAMGVMGALNALSLAAGPPIGIIFYARNGSTGLLLPALLAALAGLLAVLRLPGVGTGNSNASGFGFDRLWMPLLGANALAAIYFGGILSYLPLHLRTLHGPNVGIFFTADAIGILLLRLPTGWLVDTHGSLIPKVLGLCLTLPGIAILTQPPSVVVLVASGALTGIGAGLFITGVYADMALRSVDANRGTALSLATATFSAGIFLGSTVSGVLIEPAGFDGVLLFGFVTCALALPFAVLRLRP